MRMLVLIILALAVSGVAWGQVQPVVRVQVTPESVLVGEVAELTVTVLVPTWFARPVVYPPFELANAITRLPSDSSYSIRERVGSESWSGIVRTYEIYPLIGATYRMAGQTLNVTFANPGSAPTSVDVQVPEVVLRGIVPEGAESLDPYLAGRSLELDIEVDGKLDGLNPGDAVVLTYSAELDGLPAIFLPALAPDIEFEGVSVYRDTPVVEDGDTARRIETLTLVFNAGGEFSIPGKELSFWDTASRSIETAAADGIVFTAEGPTAAATKGGGLARIGWYPLVAMIAGLLVFILLVWRGIPVLARRLREAAARRRHSEEYAFRQLVRALGFNNASETYKVLLLWIDRLGAGMDARTFAARYGDEALTVTLTELSAALYHDAATAGDLMQVRDKLVAARKRYLARDAVGRTLRLPPLNP